MTPEQAIAAAGADRPVLIAGPTASGKSSLAARIAAQHGGLIVNADALQVFSDWRVMTSRPTVEDERALPHRLYGHVPGDTPYSTGDWLRDVVPLLEGCRPIIVGGTGLNFRALTEGLADIPQVPHEVKQQARERLETEGHAGLLAELDAETAGRIDCANPVRVQRAWEVLAATGRGLAAWQDDTGPPALPLSRTLPLVLDADRDWLNDRIGLRFDQMLETGALDEARENLPGWSSDRPSAKAIGAAELIAHLRGEMTLGAARDRAVTATRQYAKRQRTWFRARMRDWHPVELPTT